MPTAVCFLSVCVLWLRLWLRLSAGVLLCACTQAARRQLCKDFATATDIGTAAVAAVAAEPSQSGGAQVSQVQERPLGKQYRALVTGRVEQDEVGVCVFV